MPLPPMKPIVMARTGRSAHLKDALRRFVESGVDFRKIVQKIACHRVTTVASVEIV
jgi:hypothetical protein